MVILGSGVVSGWWRNLVVDLLVSGGVTWYCFVRNFTLF